jgi:hypothetical protein
MSELEWRTEKPDEAGIWWYRPPDERDSEFTPVEYVPSDRPFVIYHISMKYRGLDDGYLDGREWHGPVARRRKGGGWELAGFKPA